jgi:small GTP-binding protein
MKKLFKQNFLFKNFSELTRVKRFLPKKQLEAIKEKERKLAENKVYEGMNSSNTDVLKVETKDPDIFYPKQHPKLITNEDTSIITHKPDVMNLTRYHHIPGALMQFTEPEFESPLDSKHLDIGIIGPPNAGKSSLMNLIVGRNISAVSGKYGTTYEKIEGIYTDVNEKVQLVFKDTPGATKTSQSVRSKRILTKAWRIIPECDKLLFVVDAVKHLDITTSEAIKRLLSHKYKPSLLKILSRFKNVDEVNIDEITKIQNEEIDKQEFEPKNISTLLIMNKIDLVVNKRKLKNLQEELEDMGAFDKIFHVSCTTGYGIDNLVNYLKTQAIRRKWSHHPDIKSTQTEVEKCEEILKQIVFNRFYQEFPYHTGVMLTSWVPQSNGELKLTFQVEVKNADNIAMFVGPEGRTISEIRKELDKELTILQQKPVKTLINVIHRGGMKLHKMSIYNTKSF